MNTTIPDILATLRAPPHSLTQLEIERLTGIPQPRLSRWAAGQGTARADDGLVLMQLLNRVTADALSIL